jgi:hypothetical protein
MNTSDVREAARRLRRVYAGDAYTNVYRDQLRREGMDGSMAVAYSLADEDRQTLAAAWLEQHPADDDEPVTGDWLRSIGFELVTGSLWQRSIPSPYADVQVSLSVESTGGMTALRIRTERLAFGVGATTSFVPMAKAKTRRDVRNLLAALGIERKDGR